MNELTKLALSCGLAILWVFLNVVGTVYVLSKYPTRISLSSVAGIATAIAVALGMAAGLSPNLAHNLPESWLIVVAVGLLAFVIALLGTYIMPEVRGTTWEVMMESAHSGITKAMTRRR